MFFSFTFSIPTPFTNPFDAPNSPERPDDDQYNYASPRRKLPAPPRRPIPASPEPSSGLSRKRGRWSPEAKARASSSLDLTTTAAYIDSPAKYVDLGEERVEEAEEPRAPKRRRIAELADSVISTAFSAAVIGTAVGLTAYRLWRDRSNDHNPEPSIDSVPPPPYSERPDMSGPSYVPTGKAQISPAAKPLESSAPAPTPRRRTQPSRRAQTTVRKRRVPAPAFRTQSPASSVRRSTTYYTAAGSARSTPGPSGSSQNHSANQGPSGDELDDEDMQMSGQMDWMSAQLQALINDGKRALGTEVVVGGQDEVDDGDQNWDDDEPEATPSRAQSRTTTRAPTSLGRSTSRASRPRPARQWSGSASSSVKKYDDDGGFEVLYQTPLRAAPSKPTITDDGESEELRVAMERVRKAYGLR